MRGWVKGAIAGLVVLLVAAVTATAVAKAPPDEQLVIYVLGPPGHRHKNTLTIQIRPGDGVAVASTEASDEEYENDRGVSYGVRIPKRPLDGRIDVRFPGLGRIVGKFGPETGDGGAACAGKGTGASGHLVGRIEFRGSGGYHRWAATRAPTYFACSAPIEERHQTIFGYLPSGGPIFFGSGGFSSYFEAQSLGHRRDVNLYAQLNGSGPEESVSFVVDDHEWLHGGVAAGRWLARRGEPRGTQFEIAPGGERPASATLAPSAPFSGEATYSRRDHSLLGTLSVHLLGRTVRIAGKNTEAALVNVF